MTKTELLLRAYWEMLYERLEAGKAVVRQRIDALLRDEAAAKKFPALDVEEKYQTCREACLAFVEERIESYNPLGVQYTFDRTERAGAAALGFELDWYGGKEEFERLVAAAREKARPEMLDEQMRETAAQLIRERGAYPDKSIIARYELSPAMGKLPDYVVARAIEEIIVRGH